MAKKRQNDSMIPRIRVSSTAMATGGTVMAPGDKIDPTRDKLGIQGQSLMGGRSQDGSLSVPSSGPSPSTSRPSTATSGEFPGDAIGSISIPPEAVGVLETVINMNKALEQQIETLRMRLTVEAKNHDTERTKIVQEKEKEISKKENEIDDLKDSLGRREEKISTLVKESREKDMEIQHKEREIGDLKELVKQTEAYADELQKKVGELKGDKRRLESTSGLKDQEEEIRRLRSEIVTMKDKVNSMEKELKRTHHVIDQQSVKIKGLETEKGALSDKFKEELERAGRAMRSEVERMREVMKQQYMEMRNLREQNIEISSDVRDIKDILMKGTFKPAEIDLKGNTERLDVNNFKSPRPMQKSPNYGMRVPMTSRAATNTTLKSNSTVRSSMPMLNKGANPQPRGATGGLPFISKDENTTNKWIPTGNRQQTFNSKSGIRKK